MESLSEFNNNVDRFNARVRNITDRVHNIFGVTVDVSPVQKEHPKRYNSEFYSYIGWAQVCVQKSLGQLLNALDKYNLYHDVVSLGFSWSQINETLDNIETKLSKY